jgi:hypothetical protein
MRRRLVDWIDRTAGLWFSRALAVLCVVAGSAAVIPALLWLRRELRWEVIIPLGAGSGFIWLGVWLWRARKRLSDFDWSGM